MTCDVSPVAMFSLNLKFFNKNHFLHLLISHPMQELLILVLLKVDRLLKKRGCTYFDPSFTRSRDLVGSPACQLGAQEGQIGAL